MASALDVAARRWPVKLAPSCRARETFLMHPLNLAEVLVGGMRVALAAAARRRHLDVAPGSGRIPPPPRDEGPGR